MKEGRGDRTAAECAGRPGPLPLPRLLPLVTAVAILCLAGCAGRDVRSLGDGAYSVDCSGGYHDWSACHAAARRVCEDGGVEIVSQVSNEGSQGVGARDWSTAGSEVSRRLTFRCR
jgi:hypothetical protein